MNQAISTDTIMEEITIKARADRIFAALTSPEERAKWWGAEGRFRTTHMESDLRPGGKWLMSGIGVGGNPFTVRGIYKEIRRPHLLTFTWLPSWQGDSLETLVSFELREQDGVTTVRVTHSGLTTERARTQHRGWTDILAWLRAYAEGQN
jgi:uncharacterized protein YndB with AHSA1/START domain